MVQFEEIHHGGRETRRRSGHLTIGSSAHRNSLLFSDHPISRSPDHPILSRCLRGRFSEPVPLPIPRRDSGFRRFHPQIPCYISLSPEKNPRGGTLPPEPRISPTGNPPLSGGLFYP